MESDWDINQIANFKWVEWDDSIAISDAPPSQYWPMYAGRFDPETLAAMMRSLVLPREWWTLSYEDFLVARRPLIADVIRRGYVKLSGGRFMTPLDGAHFEKDAVGCCFEVTPLPCLDALSGRLARKKSRGLSYQQAR